MQPGQDVDCAVQQGHNVDWTVGQPGQDVDWGHNLDMAVGEAEMDDETRIAKQHGTPWKDRGPPGDEDVQFWRGQKWRANSKRWGNRGGKSASWYETYYSAMKQGATKEQAKEAANNARA